MAVKKAEAPVNIEPLDQQEIKLQIIGLTPLYFNSMSSKAKQTLLIGGGKKTAAEKKNLKHNPEQEFQESVYQLKDGPTLLGFPAPAFKGAMATAALETPGVTKSSVQRLIYIPEQKVKIWGVPKLKMDVVRSADMNRTPDIRTRAYLERWASEVTVRFIQPTLNHVSVMALLTNAGLICGIGDFRVEKGKGSFGTFAITQKGDAFWKEYQDIVKTEGRDAQTLAMDACETVDEETDSLMEFICGERAQRGLSVVA